MNDTLTPPELYCDVVCLMYDSSHARSFEYIARLFLVSIGYFILFYLETNLYEFLNISVNVFHYIPTTLRTVFCMNNLY